jgi:hypothetical protein
MVVTLEARTGGIRQVVSQAALAVHTRRWPSGAPPGELILPPPRPIVLALLCFSEKEARLEAVPRQKDTVGVWLDGRPLEVMLCETGSCKMTSAVLDGSAQLGRLEPTGSFSRSPWIAGRTAATSRFPAEKDHAARA